MKTCFPLLAGLFFLFPAVAQAAPPNVVLILSDDQAWTDYGFMGHPDIQTPHLDKLAKESAVFRRGYVPTSLCRPSLMSLITGLYPHQHHIFGNDPPKGTDRAKMLKHIQTVQTLPDILGKLGYQSQQTGKWWEGGYQLGGFTHGMTHGEVKRGGRHGDLGLKIGREGMQPIFDFIQQCEGKPFFVWYAPILPHTPHNPPERLLTKYLKQGRPVELSRYYAMCEWFDETCGQLLDHLEEKKLSDNTIVLYLADNGWIQKTPATPLPANWNNPFAPRSKRSPHEGGVRTPIMVRWPGQVKPGNYSQLASSIDLVPTVCALVGAKPDSKLPGVNLLDLISGQVKRDMVYGEIFEHDEADIDRPETSLLYRWVIIGDWKLILPVNSEEPTELYHLAEDPHETRNLATEYPDRVSQLRWKLEGWYPLR